MDRLKKRLERQKAANQGAKQTATDSESRAETKWDTSGLEASYLARGYAQQFEETAKQVETLHDFKLPDLSESAVDLGALVLCELDGFQDWMFLLPYCGGMELDIDGVEVTIITPESPLGQQLLIKTSGSTYRTPNGIEGRIIKIV